MPTYTGTTPKDIDTSTPNGATEYVSILDDAIKEAKTVLKNQYAIATKAAAYTLAAGDSVILVNGTYTMTLPTASSIASSSYTKHYWVFNIGSGTVTIGRNGANINGAASDLTVSPQYHGYHLWTDGTNWFAEYIANEAGLLKSGGTMTGNITMSGDKDILHDITTVASAATPDVFNNTGRLIDYTGTATATGFAAAPQAGMVKYLLCAGACSFTNGANFVVAGGNYTAAAGDIIKCVAETTTKSRLYPIKADGKAVAGSSKLLQMVRTAYTTYVSGTTLIPQDDTIPQNTEGTELFTRTITPTSTANRLLISVNLQCCASGGAATLCGALFQDAAADAISCGYSYDAGGLPSNITFEHEMAAGTTSAITFKIRIGASANGWQVNGSGGSRNYGGVLTSGITIMEIIP